MVRFLRLAAASLFLLAGSLNVCAVPQPLHHLQGDVERVNNANRAFQNVFGPVPALAASPFLGLALLTGAALVAEQPSFAHSDSALVRAIATNAVVVKTQSYANWWLFGIFLMLAVFTAIANSGKLHGSIGKLIHIGEAALVTVAYVVLVAQGMSTPEAAGLVGRSHIALAGFFPAFEFSGGVLLVTAALAVIPIIIVRLAFDVLIWFNPIPFVDLMFQIAKTIFSLAFFAIYLLSPFIAAVLAALCLAPALFLLPWALRFLGFSWNIVVKPLLSRFITGVRAAPIRNQELFFRAHALKARGFKKRQSLLIFDRSQQIVIQPPRRPQAARTLAADGEQVVIARATLWIEVRVLSAEGRVLDQYAIPYSFGEHYEFLCKALRAFDAGTVGVRGIVHAAIGKVGTSASRKLTTPYDPF